MRNNLLLIVTAATMVACAATTGINSSPVVKVDLDAVVESRAVNSDSNLVTSGQPSAAALEVFAEQGFKTVIDLRGKDEERGVDESSVVDALGMSYVNFEIVGLSAINVDNAAKLTEIIDAAEGPVLLHCGSANRAGALIALQRGLEGADAEMALEFGRKSGVTMPRIEEHVLEQLNSQ